MTTMTAKEQAQEIRKQLKALGWSSRQVSVRTERVTYSSSAIRCTIKSAEVDKTKVEEIALRYRQVSRDHMTGEILLGGNTYIDVEYTDEVLDEVGAEFFAALEPLAKGERTEVQGFEVELDAEGFYCVDRDDFDREMKCWGAQFTARQMAEVVLTTPEPEPEPAAEVIEPARPAAPAKAEPEPVRCGACGGTHIQIAMWVRPNTSEVLDDFGSPDQVDTTWCEDCQAHTGLRVAS